MTIQSTQAYQFNSQFSELWIKDVRCIESPNYDERPLNTAIDLLVIHAISLPPNIFGGGYIEQLFTNQLNPNEHEYFLKIHELNVSSHLLIDRQGRLTQFVPLDKRAWHAGQSQFCGREKCNDFSIGIELEGCDDIDFEEVQYQTLASITGFIGENFPAIKRSNIVGHSDIAPGRKTDPGPCFSWDKYYNLLDTFVCK